MINVSLYGCGNEIMGWIRLLEQEKIPFKIKGDKLTNFSDINIIVGIEGADQKLPTDKFFIIDPSVSLLQKNIEVGVIKKIFTKSFGEIKLHSFAKLKRDNSKKDDYFLLHEMHHDYKFPILNISRNKIESYVSLSSQLYLQGVEFKKIDFPSEDEIEILTTIIDKEKLLRYMRSLLIKCFELANLPYVHIWYYPTDSKSIFMFRQDVDYVDIKGITNLINITKKYGVKGTYFLNISGEEEYEDKLGHFNLKEPETPKRAEYIKTLIEDNNEIGNHGYWHYIFDTYEENYENLKRCNDSIKHIFGITSLGFSSPGGTWHQELGRAIENCNFLYSSNACLDNGGFPYHNYLTNYGKTKTLELPFNLVCDGFLDGEGIKIIEFKRYYKIYIAEQLINNEPISILGHPHFIGKIAEKILPFLFDEIKKNNVPNMTLSEFASWWKKRNQISISYDRNKSGFVISTSEECYLEIIFKKESILKRIKGNITI